MKQSGLKDRNGLKNPSKCYALTDEIKLRGEVTMTDNKCNGWHNYETWRVNLEIFDGFNPYEYFSDLDDSSPYDLGQSLKDYAEQVIFECGECNPTSLAGSYAQAFLDAVNWNEIAYNMIEAYKEEITE